MIYNSSNAISLRRPALLEISRAIKKMVDNKLWKTEELTSWKNSLSRYEVVLELLSEKKKKRKLLSLDKWFQNSLGKKIHSRQSPFMEKEELVKLMDWKLTRGKFRPQLPQLIASNSDEIVNKTTEKGFLLVDEPTAAIKELCQLRGVGPATASAILTAYSPERYSFMADEAVKDVLPGKIEYTLKYYLKYLEAVREKAKELSKIDTKTWTPHDVEQALWVSSLCATYGLTVADLQVSKKTPKRKSNDRIADERPSKKKLKR